MKCAAVAVELPINRLFYYSIPPHLEMDISPGRRVIVPFRGRKVGGYIIRLEEKEPPYEVKPIDSMGDSNLSFDKNMLRLASWVSQYYMCAIGEVMKATLPACVRKVRKKPPGEVSESPEKISGKDLPLILNPEQQEVLNLLRDSMDEGKSRIFLLHGITASGKTEIYLQAISYCLSKGRQAIMLVPEISLTPQTKERFESRFGDSCAVLHSGLTDRERYRSWMRIREGKASIVIGPRSCIFAPFKKLGLIIVDEEHDNSYKQIESPRYHLRDVALKRGKLSRACVCLASATPSLESYYNGERGNYKLAVLPRRIDDRILPEVDIIDMRVEKGYIFSHYLKQEIRRRLENKEKVILFLNRRGFSSFSLCRNCGYVVKCKRCSVALKYHSSLKLLLCHYCRYEEEPEKICPGCQAGYLKRFGIGTQQVEGELEKLFPQARIQRMDSDTTVSRGSHARILTAFREGETDILLGTQMIAKGLHFPEVTLVGVISADTALLLPDFRASEYTFQLLTQVAGRTGRGTAGGKVIIQTYNPRHYAILAAKEHDYISFYRQEVEFRRQLFYPPFSHLVLLTVSGSKRENVSKAADVLKDRVDASCHGNRLKILGPAPAPVSKIRGRYRWQLFLKGRKISFLRKIVSSSLESLADQPVMKKVRIIIDVDPVSLL